MVKRLDKDCFYTLLTGGNPVQRPAAVAESGRHIPDRETNSRHYIYPPAAFTGWPRLCSGSASTALDAVQREEGAKVARFWPCATRPAPIKPLDLPTEAAALLKGI